MATEVTEVKETVEVDLNDLFGTPGAESALLPEDKKKETNIFKTPDNTNTSFLDNEEEEEEEQEEKKEEDKSEEDKSKTTDLTGAAKTIDELVSQENKEEEDKDEDTTKSTPGRKKVDKSGLGELFKTLIAEEKIIPFDEDRPIEEYSVADYKDLMLANLEHKTKEAREAVEEDFFNSLPEEIQIAAKYAIVDKGKDLKGLFRLLGEAREVRDLDVDDENDQETIAREFLHSTGFGTADEIDEEVAAWKDQKTLKTKAEKFKVKLDKVKNDKVAQALADQASRREVQEKASKKYVDDIYDTLKDASINGIKLDKKTQNALYMGLVQPSYTSQVTGKPTNMLGYLLEKHQMVEPNHALIAEALFLLKDPEAYRTKVREMGAQEETKKIVKTLKTEESKKTLSSPVVEEEERSKKKIPRNNSFFKPM